jgi:hypothetical protein
MSSSSVFALEFDIMRVFNRIRDAFPKPTLRMVFELKWMGYALALISSEEGVMKLVAFF